LNDAAGDAKDEGRSYRSGWSVLAIHSRPGRNPLGPVSLALRDAVPGRHSTLLEMVNGNMSLGAVVQDYPGYDIIEAYDNQAVTALCRCRSSQEFLVLKYIGIPIIDYSRILVSCASRLRTLRRLHDCLPRLAGDAVHPNRT
jgi:hypothetical protein